ncbi:MAG: DNA repair and recombination protein RadA [Thaumarchaeota archaeon]|nr:DNA repair and recombination protein RadA [Nitrososphaerota archaeon]
MKLTSIKGLGPVTEKKLNEVGITDVWQFLSRTPNQIRDITGVDFETASKYFRNAYVALKEEQQIEDIARNGLDVENDRKNLKIISTGCKPLDSLLLGGMETKAMYEIYGEFGSNKTQLCHHMMVRVQLKESEGGLSTDTDDARVAIIDTEDTFRPERIRSIAERYGLDPDKALANITQFTTINSIAQQINLEDIEDLIKTKNVKLIVVDSLMGLFRNEYPGRGELSDRQSKVNNFVGLASRFARVYKICVLVTNQVSSNPDGFHFEPQAIGGNVVAHTSTYRIFLKKSGKNRIARMIDSPHHPDGEVMFKVTEQGIMSIEEAEEFEKEQKKEKSKIKAAETRAKNKGKKGTLDDEDDDGEKETVGTEETNI